MRVVYIKPWGKGHHEIMKILIEAKADVNFKDNQLATPLHYASALGHHECVYSLLCASADVTVRDHNCLTAGGHLDVIEILLSAGFDAI